MRQNRVHLMPPMSNFYARICVKATPSSNTSVVQFYAMDKTPLKKALELFFLNKLSPEEREAANAVAVTVFGEQWNAA